mgnify:CR=1 FL=1
MEKVVRKGISKGFGVQGQPPGNAIKLKRQNVLGSPSGELPDGVVQANWIFRSEATRKSSETPFRTK